MDYQYLGGGQESGRSSVAQALGQTYSPLEGMQKMSQEFVQQGLDNAGAYARQALSTGAQTAEYDMQRQGEKRAKKAEERQIKEEKMAYLTELLAEQEAIIDAAKESGDPEQQRRIPEVMKSMMRISEILSGNPSNATLTGILERNKDRAQLEIETAAKRGGLRQPKATQSESPPVKTGGGEEKKKDDGKRTVASSRKPISLD
jgi:hypothetical protein